MIFSRTNIYTGIEVITQSKQASPSAQASPLNLLSSILVSILITQSKQNV